jgi:hypothetical protein
MMPRFNSIITGWPKPYIMKPPPSPIVEEEPVEFGEPKENNPRSNDPRDSGRYMSLDYYLEKYPDKTEADYNALLGVTSDSNQIGGERGSEAHENAVVDIQSELSNPEERGNFQGTGRKNRGTGNRARLAANQTQGQSASLLTG